MVDYKWCTIIGLCLDIIGALFLAFGLIISKRKAVELGVAWLADEENLEENYKTPPVKDRIIQARNARIGIIFLVLGFVLQIIGSWPR
jgi:rRNA processing protein Gar1